jgi:F-type H+-transporting ATPase subunit delta
VKKDEQQIALRYVSALFEIAENSKSVDAVEKDLSMLADYAKKDAGFADMLANPLLGRVQLESLAQALSKKLDLSKLTQTFLGVLAQNKRIDVLPAIAHAFSQQAKESRGELDVDMISAMPISKSEEDLVAQRLSKAYGKKISLHISVDPSLLGGVVLKIGSQQLDASLAGKLNRLNNTLKAA